MFPKRPSFCANTHITPDRPKQFCGSIGEVGRASLTLALSCRPRCDPRLGREAIWPCKTSLVWTLCPLGHLPLNAFASVRF
jgi:hypothetical protein